MTDPKEMTRDELEADLRERAQSTSLSNAELEDLFATLRAEFELLAEDDEVQAASDDELARAAREDDA